MEGRSMTQAPNAQALSAPLLQWWSDAISMAAEGFEAFQAQGKRLVDSGFELAVAAGRDSLKASDELRGRLGEAAGRADEFVKQQAALVNEIPRDPVGASQRMIAAYVDGSRKSVELGVQAMQSYATLMSNVWGRMEQTSQEARHGWAEYVGRLQSVLESKAAKS
jgi:hypothetical protein